MMAQTLTSVRAKHRLRREEDATLHERKPGPVTHKSVLLTEAIHLLDLKPGDTVIDATLGMGGHSEAILKHEGVKVIAIDADKDALHAAAERLKRYRSRLGLVEGNFRDLSSILKKEGVESVSKVLFDLGWNMTQLNSGRGFSFLRDEPLNMSYGERPASGFTASEILNSWEEKVIADVLFGYGEERYARRIAKAIVERREIKPFESTIELVEVIGDAVPPRYRHGRLHYATKSFQALRIAVNDELGVLEKGLKAAWDTLAEDGRVAVITFHSIEDRLVKKTFQALAKKDGVILTKKPIGPSRAELTGNPSARSAKLRGIQKI